MDQISLILARLDELSKPAAKRVSDDGLEAAAARRSSRYTRKDGQCALATGLAFGIRAFLEHGWFARSIDEG
jgi:hypothetical protein